MLRATQNNVQQISSRCANYFWLQLYNHIQVCADTGNLKGMYDGIKQAIGPMQSRIIAPLKSATSDALKDKTKQMERWAEHYSELYSRVNVVSEEALIAMESLSIMDELDSEPLEDMNQALDQLSSGKATGNDGIPVEVIKCAKGTLLKELHEILFECWREGEVPQDMRDANIVTLYKNKGDRGDCNNTATSLLDIVGKLFTKVVLMKL